MLSRDDVFNELGIGPVWRLRETPAPLSLDSDSHAPAYTWDTLTDAVAHCTACKLSATRTQGVLGVGDRNADWLIIGEAPGADEDAQGEPFVGQAGKLLDAMLASIGLARGDNVYITNVLKSRPPGNRNPRAGRGGRLHALSAGADRTHPAEAHPRAGALRRAKPARHRRSHRAPARPGAPVPAMCRWW
jgi:hypothetical protein